MSRFIMPRQGVKGQNLSPADGAQLFFHNVGLTTDKDTYSDEALTTVNTNPVVSDATGLFGDIWINGDYDVLLKDKNGVQLWGPEKVISTSDPSSTATQELTTALMAAHTNKTYVAGDIVETAEFSTGNGGGAKYKAVLTSDVTPNARNIIVGTGSVANALISFVWQETIPLNVKEWGAVGDNVFNNTTILQAAIDHFTPNVGGTVLIPAGEYSFTTLSMVGNTYNGIKIVGDSFYRSRLESTTDGVAITIGSLAQVTSKITFEDLYLDSPNSTTMVDIINAATITFTRITTEACGSNGAVSKGYNIEETSNVIFDTVYYSGSVEARYGMYCTDDSSTTVLLNSYFKAPSADYTIFWGGNGTPLVIKDGVVGGGTLAAVFVGGLQQANGVVIENNYFESCLGDGILLGVSAGTYTAYEVSITGNYFYDVDGDAINLQASKGVRIERNQFVLVTGACIEINTDVTKNTDVIIQHNTLSNQIKIGGANMDTANMTGILYQDKDEYYRDRMNCLTIVGGSVWSATSGAIADGNHLEFDVTITGAALGDFAIASLNLDTQGVALSATVTAANTVTCVLNNNTGGNITIGSSVVYARVYKR